MNNQQTFTAILTHNTRTKRLNNKHILMVDIHYADTGDIFRDHCWIEESNELMQFQPKTNLYKNKISFTAKIKNYMSLNGEKLTLTKLSDIKKIK